MRNTIKIVICIVGITALFVSCLSFAGFFPEVEQPKSPDASMLILEVGEGVPGESESMYNTNFTGWAPWVGNQNGDIIRFKNFDTESRLDSFYYASNVEPGTYTLKGFFHVYTDYSKLDDDTMASYGPYEDYPYHIRQEFTLSEPVVLDVKPGTVHTFGRYYIAFKWKEGASGTSDDRWKVATDTVNIIAEPDDEKALRIAKNWMTPGWKAWNERNPATAADQ